MNNKKCLMCSGMMVYKKDYSYKYWKVRKFCSLRCSGLQLRKSRRGKGNPMYSKHSWNLGKRYTLGEKHHHWKGDNVSYSGLHKWINKYFGKAIKCEQCGKTGTGKFIQWANIDGFYMRSREHWKSLCASCHRIFDFQRRQKTYA